MNLPTRHALICCALISVLHGPVPLHAASTVLFVAPHGDDTAHGNAAQPFQTLTRARDELRTRRRVGSLPPGSVEIAILGGTYRVAEGLRLATQDSGTEAHPVIYRREGAAAVRFTGARRLTEFHKVTEPSRRARLTQEARDHVLETDLDAAGITELIPFVRGGFSSGRGFTTHPALELYVDGQPQTLARWPNQGFVMTGETPGPLTLTAWDRKPGSPEGRFRFDADRPLGWVSEPDGWLYGYWFWSWADSYEKLARIDVERREIHLDKPWHTYGYRKDQPYFALNLLSELDQPGEWYIDRASRRLLIWPDRDLSKAAVELASLTTPLIELDEVSHVRFEGLTWEGGAADGVIVRGGNQVQFIGCTVRRMSGNGIEIRGGLEHRLHSCDLHSLGRGGLVLVGGNRRTLSPSGHVVENCHIHHLSRIDHTYTPGVWMDGVGHVVRQCLIHHVASSAFRVEGNEHLVELNEAHRVVLESDDQGAVDMFGNPTYRGNVYRHNYWHHLGNWDAQEPHVATHTQRAGIRLDDAICGTHVVGNIFHRCTTGKTHFGGVQIHGGKENLVEGNLFVDCGAAVSFTPWGAGRWTEFVAKTLEAPAIDRGKYLQRYPTLAKLVDDPDRNEVRSNVVVRCTAVLLRAPAHTVASENRVVTHPTVFSEDADGRLRWSHQEAREHGLSGIPFERIGLQENAWRRRSGNDWFLHAESPSSVATPGRSNAE